MAKIKKLKPKKLTMEEQTTEQLLEVIQQGFLSAPQGEALTELQARIIKENDEDDSAQHRGGVRPLHAPIVP